MDAFYKMMMHDLPTLQPLPDDENGGLYHTAVYVHDNGTYTVFCKHRFVRHYELPQDLPPEVAVTLGLVAAQSEQPLHEHEDVLSWMFARNTWTIRDKHPKAQLGQWVTKHLFCVSISNETHDDMIYEYIGSNNDPRIKGESPSPKDTGGT